MDVPIPTCSNLTHEKKTDPSNLVQGVIAKILIMNPGGRDAVVRIYLFKSEDTKEKFEKFGRCSGRVLPSTHMHSHTHTHTHTHTHSLRHTHTHTYTYAHTHTNTNTHICISTYAHTHTHIHTYTYEYVYI